MSDDDKSELDFDLEWDDALADWEKELEGSSVAESGPMPQKAPVAKPRPAARPLYRPPDPEEFARTTQRRQAARRLPSEVDVSLDFEDSEQDSTRIAAVPKELIASLGQERATSAGPTSPPPASAMSKGPPLPAASSPPAVTMDLDDMLEGLESDTRHYPADVPKIITPIRTPSRVSPTPSAGPSTARPPAGPIDEGREISNPAAPAMLAKHPSFDEVEDEPTVSRPVPEILGLGALGRSRAEALPTASASTASTAVPSAPAETPVPPPPSGAALATPVPPPPSAAALATPVPPPPSAAALATPVPPPPSAAAIGAPEAPSSPEKEKRSSVAADAPKPPPPLPIASKMPPLPKVPRPGGGLVPPPGGARVPPPPGGLPRPPLGRPSGPGFVPPPPGARLVPPPPPPSVAPSQRSEPPMSEPPMSEPPAFGTPMSEPPMSEPPMSEPPAFGTPTPGASPSAPPSLSASGGLDDLDEMLSMLDAPAQVGASVPPPPASAHPPAAPPPPPPAATSSGPPAAVAESSLEDAFFDAAPVGPAAPAAPSSLLEDLADLDVPQPPSPSEPPALSLDLDADLDDLIAPAPAIQAPAAAPVPIAPALVHAPELASSEADLDAEFDAMLGLDEPAQDEPPATSLRDRLSALRKPAPGDDAPVPGKEAQDAEPVLMFDEPDPVADSDDDASPAPPTQSEGEPEAIIMIADDDDEQAAPVAAVVAPAVAPKKADAGADAARRTVRSRKNRRELFPLVGNEASSLAARRSMLGFLATTRSGAAKASLLLQAAELAQRASEPDEARQLLRSALEACPDDLAALRACRRDAIDRADLDEAATHLEAEARLPLDAPERTLALLALAEILLTHAGDAAGAEAAALEAAKLDPSSVPAALLLAEARAAAGKSSESAEALRGAADAFADDPAARASLLVAVGRALERDGKREAASLAYVGAASADVSSLSARMGIARVDRGEAAQALAEIAITLPEGALRDAFARRSARNLLRTAAAASAEESAPMARRALEVLGAPTTLPAMRAVADAARAANDPEAETSALEIWAGAAGGTDRAMALVRMAELHAEQGDLAAADATLRAASLAEPGLGTIRVVREVLARRAGDSGRLVDAVESGSALTAAAKVASDTSGTSREKSLIDEARKQDEETITAEVLGLDLALASGEDEAIRTSLRAAVERLSPERRTAGLLALADRAAHAGELETAEALLREARAGAPGEPVVLRPLGRIAAAKSARGAAAVWLEEANSTTGTRAAFAACNAGMLLESEGSDAIGAYRRALDCAPGYPPALWALEPLARAAGDATTLVDVYAELAQNAASPIAKAGHHVRAAMVRADSDPSAAATELARARESAPRDVILVDIALRLGTAVSWSDRAEMLLSSADGALPELRRAYRFEAAAAHEEAGEPARAAALYRQLRDERAGDVSVQIALDRAELAAGEVQRVAERRFAAVREAATDDARVLALERLAELDLEERQDPASAVLSLQSILEAAPGHIPSLRQLERYFAEQRRTDELLGIEEQLARHLPDPGDAAVHLRHAARLRLAPEDAAGESADPLLLELYGRVEMTPWIARRTGAAAKAAGILDVSAAMEAFVAESLPTPLERVAQLLRAAEDRQAGVGVMAAVEVLEAAVMAAQDHPTAAEQLARYREAAQDARGAAHAFLIAARAASARGRRVSLFYRAGVLLADVVGDEEAALEALMDASLVDVAHLDLFDRLRAILEVREEHATLSELVTRRLAAGGDSPFLVELHRLQADLRARLVDRDGEKEALRSVLALAPEHVDTLRRLSELSLEDEDYRTAAESLIRLARVRKDRDELRWVFYTLGDIYDTHIPDVRRAEAAFSRVLKLVPEDVPARERLAALYERENNLPAAIAELEVLSSTEPDPDRARQHRITLATAHERMGDARKAEQVLDTARRDAPTDLALLRAMAEFYQRQNAGSAQAVHLNRAITDFRHALGNDQADAAAWLGMAEVLTWRNRPDASRACASAAIALGIDDSELSRLVDAGGAAPGAGSAAADAALADLLAPQALSPGARAVMRAVGSTLEKVIPFDPRAYRAERLDARYAAFRNASVEVGRWFGLPDVEVWVTSAAPRVCVPVSSGPPVALLVGHELLSLLDEREAYFVLARALRIAVDGLAVAVRTPPAEFAAALGGLVQAFDQHHQPVGLDPSVVADWSRKVFKQLPRKTSEEIGPVVFEMAGAPGYDPTRMAMAASELGDRVALLATGSAPAAVGALLKLSGEPGPHPSARGSQIARYPEIVSLVQFAISEAHFDARTRTGLERS